MVKKVISLIIIACLFSSCFASKEESSQESETPEINYEVRPSLLNEYITSVADEVEASAENYTLNEDLSNVMNPELLQNLNQDGIDKFIKNYFVIKENNSGSFEDIYLENTISFTPSFVTVDALMHTYHLYFQSLQKNIEKEYLHPRLLTMSEKALDNLLDMEKTLEGSEWIEPMHIAAGYLIVGIKLLGGNPSITTKNAEAELENIYNAAGKETSPLFTTDSSSSYEQDYSQFKPRGYYADSKELSDYFRAMMWYGQMTFLENVDDLNRCAILLNIAINDAALEDWQAIYLITSFFAGESDNPTYYEYYPLIKEAYGENVTAKTLVGNMQGWEEYSSLVKDMPAPKINSKIVSEINDEDDTKGYRLFGQRFTMDGYILQNLMYDAVEENSLGEIRVLPAALDVPSAMGSEEALKILESEGETDYANYLDNLNKLKNEVASASDEVWNASLASEWLHALSPLTTDKTKGHPAFMRGSAWARKDLMTYLGNYAELKHDTILYAAQPSAYENAGPEYLPKDDRGYVEPEPVLYERLANLSNATKDGLSAYGMIGENEKDGLEALSELALDLKEISEKELRSELLSEEEYNRIRTFGEEISWIMNGAKQEDPNIIVAREPSGTPLVADIATDPNSGECLEVAIGYPATIYVAVYFDGAVRIARGSTFSYYEFTQPISERLTDTQWQTMLQEFSAPDSPDWVNSICLME